MPDQYHFKTELAIKYGVDEAIMLDNFMFWIEKNVANKKHFYDGRYWTYNTLDAYTKLFPFWTRRQIERILTSLKTQKAILTGNYNKIKIDRTVWYSFTDDFISHHFTNWGNHISRNGENTFHETVTAIPDTNTYKNTVNKVQYAELVFMSENEYKTLLSKYGEFQTKRMIEILDNYKGASGKKYKNDYKAILTWVVDKVGAKPTGDKPKDHYRKVD